MIKKLTISQVLVYYDIPELFLAKDEVGTNFICLLVSYEDDEIILEFDDVKLLVVEKTS